MAAQKHYRITVSGVGLFPIDMLRYDQAIPATEEDANRITRSHDVRAGDRLTQQIVRLDAYKTPTPGRWTSFGWRIDLVEVM